MTTGLRRFLQPVQAEPLGEKCEMCGEPVGPGHPHVVDLQSRAIQCSCRPCYLLFTQSGAAQGRFQAVPERRRYAPDFALSQGMWDSIGIPVRMAFFFRNTVTDSTVAFYPSPAGATESLLPLDAWQTVLTDNPAFADIQPDVEALLINRTDDGFECFLLPIDGCYELVGIVKLNWRGFDGGTEAWEKIDAFFAAQREASERVGDG